MARVERGEKLRAAPGAGVGGEMRVLRGKMRGQLVDAMPAGELGNSSFQRTFWVLGSRSAHCSVFLLVSIPSMAIVALPPHPCVHNTVKPGRNRPGRP